MNEYILKTTPKFEKDLRSLEKPIREAVLEQVKVLKKILISVKNFTDTLRESLVCELENIV